MPIKGPWASVPTVTGALHVPPGGRTLAWITGAVNGPPSHAVTARPSGASATAGLVPWPTVAGAGQVCPSELVQTSTEELLSAFSWDPAAASVPAALTASPGWDPDDAHPAGSWTGGDHELAACAGTASAVAVPTAISTGSAKRRRRMDRDMAGLPAGWACARIRRIASRARRGRRAQKQAAEIV
jgi:hypothetical protein